MSDHINLELLEDKLAFVFILRRFDVESYEAFDMMEL